MFDDIKSYLTAIIAILAGWIAFKKKQDKIDDMQEELDNIIKINESIELRIKNKEKLYEKIKKARTSEFNPAQFDKSRLSNKN